jgi:hypothetical protein
MVSNPTGSEPAVSIAQGRTVELQIFICEL